MKRFPLVLLTLALSPSLVFAAAPVGSDVLIISDHCASGDPLCVEKKFVEAGKPLPKSVLKSEPAPAKAPSKTQSDAKAAPDLRAAPGAPGSTSGTAQPARPAAGPQRGVKTVQTPGGYGYNFDGDSVDGKRIAPRDFIEASGPRAKVILSDELECQLPQEVTDSYGFDRKRCAKAHAPVVESGRALGGQLASEFARTSQCPKDFGDIEKLKSIVAEFDKNPFPVDTSSLIAAPLDVESATSEAHLPFGCGYNSGKSQWYEKYAFYFENRDSFSFQSSSFSVKNDYQYTSVDPSRQSFRIIGGDSYRDGGGEGDIRFIPMGEGVYIKVAFNKTTTFYYGLVFAPTVARFQQQACKKARWLAKHAKLATVADKAASQAEIRVLLMRAEALQRAKLITQLLKTSDREEMPEIMRTRLTGEARELFQVIEGKSEIKDFKFGKMVCSGQAQ